MNEHASELAAVSTSSEGEPAEPLDYDSLSIEELARLQGVEPATSQPVAHVVLDTDVASLRYVPRSLDRCAARDKCSISAGGVYPTVTLPC